LAKVSPDQLAANRQALLEAASSLFREKGVASVGVAEVCAAADLTHGALYSHFGSKDALAAEAFAYAQSELREGVSQARNADDILDFYVSAQHRDSLSTCCPMLAAASDASRQSPALKSEFAQAFEDLAHALDDSTGEMAYRSDVNLVIAASMVGVVSAARALKTVQPKLSNKLLETARSVFSELNAQKASPVKKSTRASKSSGSSKGKRGK